MHLSSFCIFHQSIQTFSWNEHLFFICALVKLTNAFVIICMFCIGGQVSMYILHNFQF